MAPTRELLSFQEVWVAVWGGILLGRHIFWDVPTTVTDDSFYMKFLAWLILLGTIMWPWLLYLIWYEGIKRAFTTIASLWSKKGK